MLVKCENCGYIFNIDNKENCICNNCKKEIIYKDEILFKEEVIVVDAIPKEGKIWHFENLLIPLDYQELVKSLIKIARDIKQISVINAMVVMEKNNNEILFKEACKNNNVLMIYYWISNFTLSYIPQYEKIHGSTIVKELKNIFSNRLLIQKKCNKCNKILYYYPYNRKDRDETFEYNIYCDNCIQLEKEEKRKKDEEWSRLEDLKWEQERKNKIVEELKKEEEIDLKKIPYKEYLQTNHWKETREKALKRANYRCQLCGNTKKLEVHHNTYKNRGKEKDEDLITLCHDCHERHHGIKNETNENNINTNETKEKENIKINNTYSYSINDILNVKIFTKEQLIQIINKLAEQITQ